MNSHSIMNGKLGISFRNAQRIIMNIIIKIIWIIKYNNKIYEYEDRITRYKTIEYILMNNKIE